MDPELDTTVLADYLTPLVSTFDRNGLENLINYRADEKLQARFEELSEKSSDGTLTPAEQRQFESIVQLSTVVAALQSRAEKLLQESDA